MFLMKYEHSLHATFKVVQKMRFFSCSVPSRFNRGLFLSMKSSFGKKLFWICSLVDDWNENYECFHFHYVLLFIVFLLFCFSIDWVWMDLYFSGVVLMTSFIWVDTFKQDWPWQLLQTDEQHIPTILRPQFKLQPLVQLWKELFRSIFVAGGSRDWNRFKMLFLNVYLQSSATWC